MNNLRLILRRRPELVIAKGKTFRGFREERMHPRGMPGTDIQMTDEELVDKFRHNASRILTQDEIERAIKSLLGLEAIDNITEIMKHVTL